MAILSKEQFIIYVVNRVCAYSSPTSSSNTNYIDQYIPVTFFTGNSTGVFSTYNEKLTTKENSQHSLTFSINKYNGQNENPYYNLFVENRRVLLQLPTTSIEFIITNTAPAITSNNVVLSVTCQDSFSYDLSKQAISITYETETPENIKTIANAILDAGNLTKRWEIDPELESKTYADFPDTQLLEDTGNKTETRMATTFSQTATTPYAALTELAKLYNASITTEFDPEASKNIIYFTNKDSVSYKGYNLRPEVNVSQFSLSYQNSEFCSMMRVEGGEDADGIMVSIVPEIPTELQHYLFMMLPVTTDDEEAAKASNTDDYMVINSGDNYTLYQKVAGKWSIEKDGYVPWTLMTPSEIKASFESLQNIALQPYYDYDSQEIDEFFYFLEKVPSFSSILFDFSYFREKGLMDDATYENITDLTGRRMRNINLQAYILNRQYYALKNRLQTYEDKLDEYVAQLAALEEEKYDYDTSDDEDFDVNGFLTVVGATETEAGTLNRTSIYSMIEAERVRVMEEIYTNVWTDEFFKLLVTFEGAGAITERIEDINKSISSYLTKKATYETQKQVILKEYAPAASAVQYTNTSTTILNGYYVPQEATYCLVVIDWKPYIISGSFIVGDPQKYSLSDGTTPGAWKNGMYCNGCITTTKDGVKKEVPNEFNKDTNTYTIYYIDNDDGNMYSIAIQKFETNTERVLYLQKTNKLQYTNYASINSKMSNVILKVGESSSTGESGSVVYSHRGTLYIKRELYEKMANTGGWLGTPKEDPFDIVDRLNSVTAQQKSLWEEFYRDYSPYIVETSYSDSDQLSISGLYMAAVKEFAKHNYPQPSYSASVLSLNQLADCSDDVKVGDIVKFYNKEISSTYSGRVRLTIHNIPGLVIGGKLELLKTYYADNYNEEENYYPLKETNKVFARNNRLEYKIIKVEPDGNLLNIYIEVPKSSITTLLVNKPILDSVQFGNNITQLLDIVPIYVTDPVELQITGISKDLRGGAIQLTVSNDRSMLNTLKRVIARNIK